MLVPPRPGFDSLRSPLRIRFRTRVPNVTVCDARVNVFCVLDAKHASKNTIVKLLEDAGEAFSEYQDRVMRNLTCKRVQVDEIWAFVYAKAKNVETALDAHALIRH